MNNLALNYNVYNNNNSAIIYDFTTRKKMMPEIENDDTYDNRAGKKCEVHALKSIEEINAMIDVYDKYINEAPNDWQRKLACRNKMLFIVGINIGVRASDLRLLTWDFFFEKMADGSLKFRKSYSLRPRKTAKTGKHVELYFNDATKKIIDWYINMYPIEDIHDYVFHSARGNEAITVRSMWRVIKETAKEAGIEQSIGSHTLRKTFGRFVYMNAADKTQALIVLQKVFNHSSPSVTLSYIDLTNDEVANAFDGLNLGIDMI